MQKGLQNDQETICFKGSEIAFCSVQEKQVSPRNMKGFQHLECASQNTYKHNGFPMILNAFMQRGLQNDQETTGFIRVRGLVLQCVK